MTFFARRGEETRPAGLDMHASARSELTAGGFAAVKRACNFGKVETEEIVQEKARPLQRGKPFEQQH
jgi:hypothetical protein